LQHTIDVLQACLCGAQHNRNLVPFKITQIWVKEVMDWNAFFAPHFVKVCKKHQRTTVTEPTRHEKVLLLQGEDRARWLAKPLAWRITPDADSPVGCAAQYKFHGEVDDVWRGAETADGATADCVQILASLPEGQPELCTPTNGFLDHARVVQEKVIRHLPRQAGEWFKNFAATGDIGLTAEPGFQAGRVGQAGVFRAGNESLCVRVINKRPNERQFWAMRQSGELSKERTS
jgi:hypothetical protein